MTEQTILIIFLEKDGLEGLSYPKQSFKIARQLKANGGHWARYRSCNRDGCLREKFSLFVTYVTLKMTIVKAAS